MLDVMRCIDALKKREFTLEELPLQYLRDKGYLTFKGKGHYSL